MIRHFCDKCSEVIEELKSYEIEVTFIDRRLSPEHYQYKQLLKGELCNKCKTEIWKAFDSFLTLNK